MLITVGTSSTSFADLIIAAWYTLEDRLVKDITVDIKNLWATDIFIENNIPAIVAEWYPVAATGWEHSLNIEKWISWKPISLLSKVFLITATLNAAVRIKINI